MLNIKVAISPDIDQAMRRFPDIMMRHLDHGVQRAAEEVARSEKNVAPKAFSTLVDSIKTSRIGVASYRVGPGVQHAEAMEFGTKPGAFPDIQHIRDWIRIKHISPENDEFNERDLAFMIARGIRDKGVTPHPFAEPTVKKEGPRVHEIVNRAVRSGLREAGMQ